MIRDCLQKDFVPSTLDIIDESHLHIEHPGHNNRGHFKIRLISKRFNAQPLIARHRMVYAALGKLMETDIHALSIDAIAPDENE